MEHHEKSNQNNNNNPDIRVENPYIPYIYYKEMLPLLGLTEKVENIEATPNGEKIEESFFPSIHISADHHKYQRASLSYHSPDMLDIILVGAIQHGKNHILKHALEAGLPVHTVLKVFTGPNLTNHNSIVRVFFNDTLANIVWNTSPGVAPLSTTTPQSNNIQNEILFDHSVAFQMLLDHGLDINTDFGLSYPSYNYNDGDTEKRSSIFLAIGNLDRVKRLLSFGANVNYYQKNKSAPIHKIMDYHDRAEYFQLFLDNGLLPETIHLPSEHSQTPLICCILSESVKADVRTMFSNGKISTLDKNNISDKNLDLFSLSYKIVETYSTSHDLALFLEEIKKYNAQTSYRANKYLLKFQEVISVQLEKALLKEGIGKIVPRAKTDKEINAEISTPISGSKSKKSHKI